MKKRILTYIPIPLQGIGIAALGTLNIADPKAETLFFVGICVIFGLALAFVNTEEKP